MHKRSNSSSICQWYCCNCGQSYGSVIYKNGGSDSSIYSTESSQVSDTEDCLTENRNEISTSSITPYTSSLSTSTTPVSTSSPNSTLTNEPGTCQLVEPPSSHLQKIMYYSQIIYSNSGVERHHSSNSLSLPPLIHSASFPPAGLSPLEEETSSIQSHLGPCSPESAITEPEDRPNNNNINNNNSSSSQILIDPPNRFNCHRCYHMMCPYCPKLRMKDLAF